MQKGKFIIPLASTCSVLALLIPTRVVYRLPSFAAIRCLMAVFPFLCLQRLVVSLEPVSRMTNLLGKVVAPKRNDRALESDTGLW